MGGDEFVILLPHLSTDIDQTVHHAFHVAEKIHAASKQPFSIEGHRLYSACSIGITTIDHNTTDADEILRRADTAMYQAKEAGRDHTRFYNPDMDKKVREYLYIQNELRHAIEHDDFALHFQPIVRIECNTVAAAESLLRWRDRKGQTVSPSRFIPIAEESGLINTIGRWVINAACRQMARWQKEESFTLEYLCVNMSPRQLIEANFSAFVLDAIRDAGIQPSQLRLEITETALIENFEKTKNLIEALNMQGVKFIIDDFGTGYASLSYLKQLNFSALKIDKSFVRDILNDPHDAALVRAIIDIARQFDYQVIAEGVENEAQRQMLLQADDTICFQGYLCSPAIPANAFKRHMRTNPSSPSVDDTTSPS